MNTVSRFFFVLCMILHPVFAFAETAYIGGDNPWISYKVYKLPRARAKSAGYIKPGTRVTIIKTSRDWSQISVHGQNRTAWIKSNRLQSLPFSGEQRKILNANENEKIHVLSYPATEGSIIGTTLERLQAGDNIELYHERDDGYSMVKTEKGRFGFILTSYLIQDGRSESTSIATVDEFIGEGLCAVVISSHSSKSAAVSAATRFAYAPWQKPSIFETQDGKFLFSVGNLRSAEVPAVLKELILGGDAPNAECVSGHDFAAKYDKRGNLVSGASSEPKQCYFVVASRKTEFEAAQLVDELSFIDASKFEVFLTENGWYAITLGLVDEDKFQRTKSSLDVPDDSFCTSGKDFTQVPHVCARQPVNCSEGYTVQYDSCEAQNVIGFLGVEFDKAFCKMPEKFPRETLVIDDFIGLSEDREIFSFTGYTSSEDFVVKITPTKSYVEFFWQEYVPPPPPKVSSSSGGSDHRCIYVDAQCTSGFGCVVDDVSISGSPGIVDNSWSSPHICTGYGGIEGTYSYTMTIGNTVCSGSFPITSRAQTGVTVDVYSSSCDISYVNEF